MDPDAATSIAPEFLLALRENQRLASASVVESQSEWMPSRLLSRLPLDYRFSLILQSPEGCWSVPDLLRGHRATVSRMLASSTRSTCMARFQRFLSSSSSTASRIRLRSSIGGSASSSTQASLYLLKNPFARESVILTRSGGKLNFLISPANIASRLNAK